MPKRTLPSRPTGLLAAVAVVTVLATACSDGDDEKDDSLVTVPNLSYTVTAGIGDWCGDVLVWPLPDANYVEIAKPGGALERYDVPLPDGAPKIDWQQLTGCVQTSDGPRVALAGIDISNGAAGGWVAVLDTAGEVVWSSYDAVRSPRIKATAIQMSLQDDAEALKDEDDDVFLDPGTGEQLWSVPEDESPVLATTTVGGELVKRTDDGWEVRNKDGQSVEIDNDDLTDRGEAVYPIDAGLLFLSDDQAALVDASSGEQLWNTAVPGLDPEHVKDDQILVDAESGTVVVESRQDVIAALSPESGELLWTIADLDLDEVPDGATYQAMSAGHGQVLLFGEQEGDNGDRDQVIVLVDAATGEQVPTHGESIGFIAEDGYVVPAGKSVKIIPFDD